MKANTLDGYQILIVNGNLTEIPTADTIKNYPYLIKLVTGDDTKYLVPVKTYSDFIEALQVLRELVEAGTYTIISISYHMTVKPYICFTCEKPLSFQEAFLYEKFVYCSEHLPAYDKHQQW